MAAAPSPLFRGVMLLLLYAIPLWVAIRPVGVPLFDPDIWWHLAVGQWLVEHRTVTTTDPFSRLDQPWVAYSWLYELLIYGLYQAFGLAGIIVYRAGMSLAVVLAVHALVCRLEPRFAVALAWTALAVLALASMFSERPWLFTVLFGTLTLHAIVLVQREESRWWIWTLPVLYILWANIHIQFVYGLCMLALACLTALQQRRLMLLAGLCFLATLLTPYHVRLYWVVLEYATQPGPFRWVNELKALTFREASDWAMLVLALAGWFALGRKPGTIFETLLLAVATFFAFRARRDLWFVVLASLVVLASRGPEQVAQEARFRLSVLGKLAVTVGLAGIVLLRVATQDLSPTGLQAAVATKFPVAAVEHVRKNGYPGPLFNDFNWGGYLIWALPEMPVAIDGRTNLHGDARLERYGRVWSGLDGWSDDPDLTAAGVVLAPRELALSSLLLLDKRFVLVYEDQLARVFLPVARKP